MELYEKVESAIVSYLNQYVDGDLTTVPPNTNVPPTFYWPASLQRQDKTYRIFTGESDGTKDGQAILVIAEDAEAIEEPQYTGNFHVPVQIWLRTPIKTLTAKEKTDLVNPSLVDHKAAATVLEHAIMQDPFLLARYFTQSVAALNVYSVMDRRPMRQETSNYWASGWSFTVYAMGISG
jgi:hypothetical protein